MAKARSGGPLELASLPGRLGQPADDIPSVGRLHVEPTNQAAGWDLNPRIALRRSAVSRSPDAGAAKYGSDGSAPLTLVKRQICLEVGTNVGTKTGAARAEARSCWALSVSPQKGKRPFGAK
jgi:hypothetical protein